MECWIPSFLGFLAWFPLLALGTLVGRVLAQARREQTRPVPDDFPAFRNESEANGRAAPGGKPIVIDVTAETVDDEWSAAWSDALA